MAKLGDNVRDVIAGFEGVVTGRAEYLYGCVQVFVSPRKLDKEGKLLDGVWFDEGRVEVVESGAVERPPSADEREGGPLTCPAPARR